MEFDGDVEVEFEGRLGEEEFGGWEVVKRVLVEFFDGVVRVGRRLMLLVLMIVLEEEMRGRKIYWLVLEVVLFVLLVLLVLLLLCLYVWKFLNSFV